MIAINLMIVAQSVSTLSSFFLAMLLYPEVLKKAREELDRVIGRGRLPDFTDRDSLPYVTAIVKETLRFVKMLIQ
jgi:cytochrome P450